MSLSSPDLSQDHPRSRGNNLAIVAVQCRVEGSPPLAREQQGMSKPVRKRQGITPARAGTTAKDPTKDACFSLTHPGFYLLSSYTENQRQPFSSRSRTSQIATTYDWQTCYVYVVNECISCVPVDHPPGGSNASGMFPFRQVLDQTFLHILSEDCQ